MNATKISTVSETYRDELKYEYYSKNLVDVINRRDRDFYGVLNGLEAEIAPELDLEIEMRYNLVDVFANFFGCHAYASVYHLKGFFAFVQLNFHFHFGFHKAAICIFTLGNGIYGIGN